MKWSIFLLLLSFSYTFLDAQQSGPQYYRSAVMNGNNIRTVFGNWGVVGQPIDSRPRGAWLFDANGYIGDESIFIGVELPIRDYNGDQKLDTIHSVITCPVARPAKSPDQDPVTSAFWTFMPVDGFFNPDQQSVAMSNDPSTWPSSWKDSLNTPAWHGLFGMGKKSADLESYYQMDDQNDKRFNFAANNIFHAAYIPDTLNPTRNGAGLRVDVRYLQYNDYLFKDVLFRVYDITNESSFDYKKVVFGSLMGTLVGVTGNHDYGEYDDDYSILYKKENIIITGDFDNNVLRNPLWNGPVGKVGETFLSTPSSQKIASYIDFTPAGMIPLGTDAELWNMLTPGTYQVPSGIQNDTVVVHGDDADYTFGSNYFELKSKQTKRIVSALAYGYSKDEIGQKVTFAKILQANDFDIVKFQNSAHILEFGHYRELAGNVPIHWQTPFTGSTVDLFLSSDAGRTWNLITRDIPNTGTYNWNTEANADCAFGLLRMMIKDTSGAYMAFAQSESYFRINNPSPGPPFVGIFGISEQNNSPSSSTYAISMLTGDPDNMNTPLNARIYYSVDGVYHQFLETTLHPDSILQDLTVDISKLPNSPNFHIKIDVTDGGLICSDSIGPFNKRTDRSILPPDYFYRTSGEAQSNVQVHIADRSNVTSDSYVLSFVDTAVGKVKTFSVFDQTKGIYVVKDVPLTIGAESQIFDGLALYVDDVGTKLDTYTWNHQRPYTVYMNALEFKFPGLDYHCYPYPGDFFIVWGDSCRSISLAPILGPAGATPELTANFSVIDRKTLKKIEFAGDWYTYPFIELYLVHDVLGKKRITWYVYIRPDSVGAILPVPGDTLTVSLCKGISYLDSFAIKNPAMIIHTQPGLPLSYALSQNYPNPFNPETNILFSLPEQCLVTLVIYDILGRQVTSLVNDKLNAGRYSIRWNAEGFSSGIYFCRLTTPKFSDIKKMVLIR